MRKVVYIKRKPYAIVPEELINPLFGRVYNSSDAVGRQTLRDFSFRVLLRSIGYRENGIKYLVISRDEFSYLRDADELI